MQWRDAWLGAKTPKAKHAVVTDALAAHGTVRAAAEALGISAGYVSRIRSGARLAQVPATQAITEAQRAAHGELLQEAQQLPAAAEALPLASVATGQPWQHWQQWQHGEARPAVATFFADPLTESPAAPILGDMDARAVAATEPQEPVAFSKPLNMSVGWDDLMTFVRVQTELRAILRREPAHGETFAAMLAYLARHAGPEDGPATAPVMAAALAPFLREVRS